MSKSKKQPKKDGPAETLAVTVGSAFARPQWQYLVEYGRCGALPPGKLDELGAAGWELCATVATPAPPSDMSSGWPGVVQFYFKRLLQPNNPVTHGRAQP